MHLGRNLVVSLAVSGLALANPVVTSEGDNALIQSTPSLNQPQQAVVTPSPMAGESLVERQDPSSSPGVCGTLGHVSGCVGPSGASYTYPGGTAGYGPAPTATTTKVLQSSMDFTSTMPLNGPTATVVVSGASALASNELAMTRVVAIFGLAVLGAVRGLI